MALRQDLIFDVGFHRGEDTDFYLKKGFRVVGVEANPELCGEARERFRGPIEDGRLTLVNRAIAAQPGKATFYRSDRSEWGTIDPLWAERNARMGVASEPLTVETTTMAALISEFGAPYYAKFDIEGFDMVGVEGLRVASDRPLYISVESEKDSFKALRREFEILTSLGYDRFKIVSQEKVPKQRCKGFDHSFPRGSSGQFGEDAPGKWLSAGEAIEAYKPIFVTYALVGDDPIFGRPLRSLAWRLGMRPDWYDTHARLVGG
jgi:FkbM family methyltransferase